MHDKHGAIYLFLEQILFACLRKYLHGIKKMGGMQGRYCRKDAIGNLSKRYSYFLIKTSKKIEGKLFVTSICICYKNLNLFSLLDTGCHSSAVASVCRRRRKYVFVEDKSTNTRVSLRYSVPKNPPLFFVLFLFV